MTALPEGCFTPASGLLPLEDALASLRTRVVPITGVESVPLEQAAGRILAEALVSERDIPAFANVAVDGWAFAHAGLDPQAPTRLRRLEARAAAGHPFEGEVPVGACVRVLTGALLPQACDTAVMEEEVEESAETVLIPAHVRKGAGCRPAGEDVARGQRLFEPGLVLEPRHIAVAAELGLPALPVHTPLRLGLLSSGDELIEPGQPFARGRLYDANRPMLKALLRQMPVEVHDLGIQPDRGEAVRSLFQSRSGRFDVLLASGGASFGEEDHIVRTAAELGELHFWRIAMKPGRPLAFGRIGDAVFVGLPGNPVASFVCFIRLARPMLMALAGAPWRGPLFTPLPAAFEMKKRPGRTELLRARLVSGADGGPLVERITREGSGIVTSLTDADGLVELSAGTTAVLPGQPVPFASFKELGAV